jgi:hypothetical protein
LIHPDALVQLLTVMDGKEDRLAMMGVRVFQDGQRAEDGGANPPPPTIPVLRTLIQRNFGPPHAFLSSRQAVLSVGGFEESLKSCEDWDLWSRLVLAGNELVSTPFVGAYYRLVANSLSTNQRRMLETRTKVLLRIHEAICRNPELLSALGNDLLAAEQRVRRFCIVQGFDASYVHPLSVAMCGLEQRGFVLPRSRLKRVLDRFLGVQAERLAMLSYFLFEKTLYQNYAKGIY